MKYITKEGLVQLTQWKYQSSEYTFLDNVMQPYWNNFVKLFPLVSKYFSMTQAVVVGPKLYNTDGYNVDDFECPHLGISGRWIFDVISSVDILLCIIHDVHVPDV